MHHPKSHENRLYLSRTEGRKGLIQLELSYKSTTIGLDKDIQETQAPSYTLSKTMTTGNPCTPSAVSPMKFSRELGVPAIPPAEDEANTTYARRTKAKVKHQGRPQLRSMWESKALHGKYPQRMKQADVDQDKTHRWLKAAGLKAETEGFIIAAQDQSLPTRWYQHNILKKPDVDPKCSLMAVSMRPLTTWSLAALNWLKLKTSTTTTRQLHTCTGRSAKSLALR